MILNVFIYYLSYNLTYHEKRKPVKSKDTIHFDWLDT